VCPGHPDEHFVKMLKSRGGKVMAQHNNDVITALDSYAPIALNGKIYHQIVRSISCRVVCKGTKCDHRNSYRDSLCKSYHHWDTKEHSSQAIELQHQA